MGRVEEALRKLQARSALTSPQEAPPQTLQTRRLARVSEELTRGSSRYGGKRVDVDLSALRSQGLLAPDSEQRRLADEYRVIKRPLVRNAHAAHDPPLEHGNLVMVASAVSGEGKTFSCLNLCLSMAQEKDWSVLLVDADCGKPHLTQLFGAEGEPGLLDLLREEGSRVDSAVMPTNIPSLNFLPGGGRDGHANELLSSGRMSALCAELSASDPQRLVVFDSSPLLLTTESALLSTHVGQIVMVVRANKTPQQAVAAAVEKLDASKAISMVLNQLDRADPALGYSDYGYGAYGA